MTIKERLQGMALKFLGWNASSFSFNHNQTPRETATADPKLNSAVMACTNWAIKTLPEAPVYVGEPQDKGAHTRVVNHPLEQLLKRPNPNYSGRFLQKGLVVDAIHDGNAFILIGRGQNTGAVRELYYESPLFMTPKYNRAGDLLFYERRVNGTCETWPIENVIHLRFGYPNPDAPGMAVSPLKSLLSEILTDSEATLYSRFVLKNWGVWRLLISPADADVKIGEDQADAIKNRLIESGTGGKTGEPVVMSRHVKLHDLAKSPNDMAIDTLRRFPESRIPATIGIPAMVAGLSTGEDTRTYSNYAEAREAAYEEFVRPTQEVICEELTNQLLLQMQPGSPYECYYDLSRVRVLQPDRNKEAERVSTLYQGTIISQQEARLELGYEEDADPSDTFYNNGPLGGVMPTAALSMRQRNKAALGRVMAGDEEEPTYD